MQGDYNIFLRMVIILSVFLNILISQTLPKSNPVHTYSIIAYDPDTGEFGVAVQSHWFSVGSIVPWAKAGVGAVATQSFVKVEYGPDGLALMVTRTKVMKMTRKWMKMKVGMFVRLL